MSSKDCKVCGRRDQVTCLRYGAQSCCACAAFFVRAASRGLEFECNNFDMCLICKFFAFLNTAPSTDWCAPVWRESKHWYPWSIFP